MRYPYLLLPAFLLAISLHAQTSTWESFVGPPGGHIYCVAQANSIWYVGTGSGIYYSIDEGENWQRNDWAPQIGAVISLEIYPGEILFNSVTKDTVPYSTYERRNTLFRSTDDGQTWSSQEINIVPYGLYHDYDVFRHGAFLYADNTEELFRSANNGNTWVPVTIALPEIQHNDEIILSQTNNFGPVALYFKNGGTYWLSLPAPPNASDGTYALGLGHTMFYFGRYASSFRSTDFGTTWQSIGTPFGNSTPYECRSLPGGILAALIGQPATDDIMYISADDGLTWTPYGGNPRTQVLGVAADGDQFGVATALGFYKNYSGGNFLNPANTGLRATNVKKMLHYNDQLLATAPDGLWRTFDDGNSWLQTFPQNQLANAVDIVQKGDTLCTLTTSNFFFSTDQGDSWTTLYNNSIYEAFYYPAKALAVDGDRLLVAADGVYFSDNFGSSWQEFGGADFFETSAVLVAAGRYFALSLDGILRSEDHGLTWEIVYNGYRTKGQFYYSNGRVLALTSFGAVFSDDFGDNWQVTVGLPQTGMFNGNLPVTGFADADSVLYAAVDFHGVYYSTDGGVSWSLFSADLPNPRFQDLLVYNHDLYAACTDGGIWRYHLGPTSTHSPQIALPLTIWPNPVSQSIITLDWPEVIAEKIKIQVFNDLGQCIVQTNTLPINGQFQLPVETLQKGVYRIICTTAKTIRAGSFIKI